MNEISSLESRIFSPSVSKGTKNAKLPKILRHTYNYYILTSHETTVVCMSRRNGETSRHQRQVQEMICHIEYILLSRCLKQYDFNSTRIIFRIENRVDKAIVLKRQHNIVLNHGASMFQPEVCFPARVISWNSKIQPRSTMLSCIRSVQEYIHLG